MGVSATYAGVPLDALEVWHDGTAYNYLTLADRHLASPPATPKSTLTQLFSGSLAVPTGFFGGHISNWVTRTKDTPNPTGRLMLDFWRTQDSSVFWPHIETSPGVFDWSGLDAIVAAAESLGIDVCYNLYFTPTFYASDLTKFSQYSAQGGWPTMPTDTSKWTTFISTLVTRYGTRIKYYEVWNEVNYRSSATVGCWFGTAAQMVTLTQLAYNTIKSINPAAVVISPNYMGEIAPVGSVTGVNGLDAFLAAGGGSYVDEFGYHFYLAYNHTPAYLPTYISLIRAKLDSYGFSAKKLSNSEFGNQEAYDMNGQKPFSWADRNLYMQRSIVYSILGGCNRIVWYAFDAKGYGGGKSHGMLDDSVPRQEMMVDAWNEVVRALRGKTITRVNRLSSQQLCVVAGGVEYVW